MAIEVKNASFTYPNGFCAVKDISLTIHRGEKVAIVGQNGAGKTTFVKMLNGIHKPTCGDVVVDGINTKEKTTAQIAKYVGYVFQNPDSQIFNRTVISEIQYMLKRSKIPSDEIQKRTRDVLELTELTPYAETNPYDLPLPLRKFLAIAAVLAVKPQYLIFDEPTAGQDYRGNKILKTIIDQMVRQNIGVITISHDMEFVAENFDRVIAMAHKNVILDDHMRNVFWNYDVIEESKIKQPAISEISSMLNMKQEKIIFTDELIHAVLNR